MTFARVQGQPGDDWPGVPGADWGMGSRVVWEPLDGSAWPLQGLVIGASYCPGCPQGWEVTVKLLNDNYLFVKDMRELRHA